MALTWRALQHDDDDLNESGHEEAPHGFIGKVLTIFRDLLWDSIDTLGCGVSSWEYAHSGRTVALADKAAGHMSKAAEKSREEIETIDHIAQIHLEKAKQLKRKGMKTQATTEFRLYKMKSAQVEQRMQQYLAMEAIATQTVGMAATVQSHDELEKGTAMMKEVASRIPTDRIQKIHDELESAMGQVQDINEATNSPMVLDVTPDSDYDLEAELDELLEVDDEKQQQQQQFQVSTTTPMPVALSLSSVGPSSQSAKDWLRDDNGRHIQQLLQSDRQTQNNHRTTPVFLSGKTLWNQTEKQVATVAT